MLGKLNNYLADSSAAMKKVFNQPGNITVLVSTASSRFTKALTKKQRMILDAFAATAPVSDSL
jgi:hypothetical protein